MNYNETTGESINRSVYQDIREKFKQYAKNWNGIWTAYLNKSPAWGGRWVPGNKGSKIQMRDTIPVNVRYLKYLDNNGTANHEQQNIVEESNRIHTVGNENNIRRSIHSLNNKMVNYFGYDEYALVENYDKTFLKSYKVKLVEYDTNLDVIQSEEFWTDSYQTFKKDDIIKLYKDADLKEFVMEAPVVYRTNNPYKKVCVEWTEDRYYVTHNVSIVDGTSEEDGGVNSVFEYTKYYENPTNLNSNNSQGVICSCDNYTNIYALFKNNAKKIGFNKVPSASSPIIIYFRTTEKLKLTSYMLRADNQPSNWESPCDWTLEASNNNINWTVIDRHTNEDNNWGQNRSRTFTISNPQPYLYFRLVVTRSRTKNKMELGGMRFYGYTGIIKLTGTTTQPELIGENTNVDVASKGVKKYSQLTENPNDVYEGQTLLSNPEATADVDYNDIEDTILSNQECIYTFDNNSNWKLDNEDVIRKTDYQQLQQILKKIEKTLKLRDGWFKDDRCDISCQVACQNRCQVACQACNTKQCHDQKCGTH